MATIPREAATAEASLKGQDPQRPEMHLINHVGNARWARFEESMGVK